MAVSSLIQPKQALSARQLFDLWWPRAAFVFVAASIVVELLQPMSQFSHVGSLGAFSAAYNREDIDRAMIGPNVAAVHTWAGTLRWWRGPWCGYGHYWRPLTSTAFWIEDRIFGLGRVDLWEVANLAFSGVFVLLLGIFVYCLTKRAGVALLAVYLFAGTRPLTFLVPPQDTFFSGLLSNAWHVSIVVGLYNWIDQVESWHGALIVLGLICALRRRWWWSLASVVIGIGCKEPAWFAFPMLIWIALRTNTLRDLDWRKLCVGVSVAVLLIWVRHEVGATNSPGDGSNASWPLRYLGFVDGVLLSTLTSQQWPAALLGIAIASVILWVRLSAAPKLILSIVAAAIVSFASAVASGRSQAVMMTMLLDPTLWLSTAVVCGVYVYVVVVALRSGEVRKQSVTLLVIAAIASITIAVNLQSSAGHISYVPAAFQSALAATVIAGAWRRLTGFGVKSEA
jgi:hypothetical protein